MFKSLEDSSNTNMHNEILYFINDFKKYESNNVLMSTFTEGYCYDFAYMIWRNHNGVRIFFIVNGDHYIAEYNGVYYDISGIVTIEPDIALEEDDIGISKGIRRLKRNKYEFE